MARAQFDMPVGGQYTTYDPLQVGGGKTTREFQSADGFQQKLVEGGLAGKYDAEVGRYRGLGEAAAQRQAYQADQSRALANEAQGVEARGYQGDATGLMRDAAMGNAPSAATIMGNQAAGQSLEAQLAGGSGARVGLGGAAVQMQAQRAMGASQLGALGQYTGMRGAEMATAQNQYGAAGTAMRAGDYTQQGMAQQRAELQGQSELAQRGLNQGAQMGYEQMAINNQQANSDNDLRMATIAQKEKATAQAADDARQARSLAVYTGVANAVGSAMGNSSLGDQTMAAAKSSTSDPNSGSDERMKDQIVPLSEDAGSERHWDRDVSKSKADVVSGASLSGPEPKYGRSGLGAAAAARKATHAPPRKMTDEELNRLADQMGAQQSARNKASLDAGPAVGGDWLDQYMLSDDRTKLAQAWRDGANHASEAAETGKFGPVPEYVAEEMPARKQQPAEAPRKAAEHVEKRRDPTFQRNANAAATYNQGVINGVTDAGGIVAGPGATLGGTIMQHQADEEQMARWPVPAPSWSDKVQQWRDSMFSDERTKTGAHGERDMGAALAEGFKPFEYEYKPQFAGAERQEPGEKNVGPMAQNMAGNEVTGTAVKRGPDGLLVIDIPKTTKVNSAGIGYLAAEQQRLKAEMAKLKGGR